MRIPAIRGLIKRRLLVNFRAQPQIVQDILPQPFRAKLQNGSAIVGVCLIRLENIGPAGWPGFFGIASENAAHRIAVEWTDKDGSTREGVFIPRRDTSSWLNRVAGGRLFPGEHHLARFTVSDKAGKIHFQMESDDRETVVRLVAEEANSLPVGTCFGTLATASAFFERGCLGFSPDHAATKLDGIVLQTKGWRVSALSVSSVYSSFFANPKLFPDGSIEFDHALIMRDIAHEWRSADAMRFGAPGGR